MKVLQINTVYAKGSTGNIVKLLHDACIKHNIECISAHRCFDENDVHLEDTIEISSKWDSRIHGWLSRFTMFKGVGSFVKTAFFLKKVNEYSPDLIHLHNLHGSYVNLPLLFAYIKKNNIPVVWTLHDCWAFTAICSHFVMADCGKWKDGCHNCPLKRRFSSSLIDFTSPVWKTKKKWFSGLENVIVVTPSKWLEGLAKRSFLNDYGIKTIYNGIDFNIFKETSSDFRQKYNLQYKKIVLGVAFDWGFSKGLDVFIELSKRLDDEYQVVLVGTNEATDKKLPESIISVHRTETPGNLAAIYTSADVFVNPTREEVLGLVNLESLACGTPVVTFRTGGSPECIDDSCGVVTDVDDVNAIEREIIRICSEKPYTKEACKRRASLFDKAKIAEEYIGLYKEIIDVRTQ